MSQCVSMLVRLMAVANYWWAIKGLDSWNNRVATEQACSAQYHLPLYVTMWAKISAHCMKYVHKTWHKNRLCPKHVVFICFYRSYALSYNELKLILQGAEEADYLQQISVILVRLWGKHAIFTLYYIHKTDASSKEIYNKCIQTQWESELDVTKEKNHNDVAVDVSE